MQLAQRGQSAGFLNYFGSKRHFGRKSGANWELRKRAERYVLGGRAKFLTIRLTKLVGLVPSSSTTDWRVAWFDGQCRSASEETHDVETLLRRRNG